MKWYAFFTAAGIGALGVFGMYAQNIIGFRYSWLRPVMMLLNGVAFLASQWMVAEEECDEELVLWGRWR